MPNNAGPDKTYNNSAAPENRTPAPLLPSFETLTPETIIAAGEQYLNRPLGGVITPYNSYVNRVYGVRDQEGNPYIMKFYRPGRWSKASILEEHTFLKECAAEEVPVVLPIPGRDGRTFDITAEEDWTRLGAIVGRMHMAGKKKNAEKRVVCSPEFTTAKQVDQLMKSGLIP